MPPLTGRSVRHTLCNKVPTMKHALSLALTALVLSGCASHKPEDFKGTWINQHAIDVASKGTSLRKALSENGPVLEWRIDVDQQKASLSNGFEAADGHLVADKNDWQVTFDAGQRESLSMDGQELVQAPGKLGGKQVFERSSAPSNTPLGGAFEKALYQGYLGGNWKIVEGPGQGNYAQFRDDGMVTGLPGPDRYALCLAGDCATMSGENDSLWLEREQRGSPWIFKRDGKTLEIFQAVNRAQPNEMPQLAAGERRWVLEKQ